MERLHFSIVIDAPKDRVCHTMLDEETFQTWTEVFAVGSHYRGDWSEGSRMVFLAPDENGSMQGMISRIRQNRPCEYVSIEHLGIIQNGEEDTSSEDVRKWAGAQENYIFNDIGDRTEVLVEMDTDEEYREMFEDRWPKALQKLKKMAEG